MFPEPTEKQLEEVEQKLLDLIRSNFSNEQIYHLYCYFDETTSSEIVEVFCHLAAKAAPENFSFPV